MIISDYMSPEEAARFIGIHRNNIRYWANKNKLTKHRHPATGFILYKVEDIVKLKEIYGQKRSRKDKAQ